VTSHPTPGFGGMGNDDEAANDSSVIEGKPVRFHPVRFLSTPPWHHDETGQITRYNFGQITCSLQFHASLIAIRGENRDNIPFSGAGHRHDAVHVESA
jgi:hypothetical protein